MMRRILGYIIAYLLLVFGTIAWIGSSNNWFLLVILAGAYMVYRSSKKKKKTSLKWTGKSGNKELDELSRECFDKAVDDFNALEEEKGHVSDKELKKQLQKMQDIAWRFLQYLQEHPEKISMARRFVDYYQDRALMMVQKYQDLEKTGLKTNEVEAAKWKIKQVLNSFDEAYEEQFTRVLNAQIMDLDAELKVMKQSMEADGIYDKSQEAGQQKTAPRDQGKQSLQNFWKDILKEIIDEETKKK